MSNPYSTHVNFTALTIPSDGNGLCLRWAIADQHSGYIRLQAPNGRNMKQILVQ